MRKGVAIEIEKIRIKGAEGRISFWEEALSESRKKGNDPAYFGHIRLCKSRLKLAKDDLSYHQQKLAELEKEVGS